MPVSSSSQPDSEQPPRSNVFARAVESLRTNRDFRFLWLSNLFFIGGNWSLTLVLGWLVYETTASEFKLAIFTALRLAPMWLGPISGLLADRYNRALIIRTLSLWAVCVIVVLSVVVFFTMPPYWSLMIAGLLTGLSQSPSQPARNALTMQLVGRKKLANANALSALGMGLTQAAAPAIGGVILSQAGAAWALLYAAAWYLLAAVSVWQVKVTHQTMRAETTRIFPMLSEGLRLVMRNRVTATMVVITLAANILIWPVYQSFMPVFASDVLNLGPAGLGRLMAFVGIGSFFGSFVIAALGDFRYKGAMFVFGSTLWGAGWALFGLSDNVVVSHALLLGIGLIGAAFGVLQSTLMLMASEPEVQGRALGVLELAIGAMPFGTLLLGSIAQAIGVGPTTTVAGTIFVVILIVHTIRVPDMVRYTGEDSETTVIGT